MSTDYQIRINKMNCELMLTYDTPAYMFNVYKNQPSRQTGSRNLMGPKTLTTIWGTYMKLVIKQDVARYVVLRIPPHSFICVKFVYISTLIIRKCCKNMKNSKSHVKQENHFFQWKLRYLLRKFSLQQK